ncbi:MAG: FAD-dependent oxidoreductase [Verrucomicrobiota bacterium]
MPNPSPDPANGSNVSLSPDIVVVGGGFAGVMAALAAKTPDNRVMFIEPSNVLGGQGTAGGVAGFCGDTARVNGEFAAIVAKLAVHGLIEPYRPNDDRRAYDLEWCAFFLQETVVERGIEVLLLSRVVAAEAKDGRIGRITVSTSGGLIELTPKFAIDASGACVLAVLTGFPFMHEGANRQLPMSLYFTLWDTGKPVKPVLPEGCPRWQHDDEIPMTSLHRFPSGKVEVKMKVVGFDAADGLSRSAAEIFARRQMHGLIYYLQTVGYRGRKLDTHVLASVSRGIGVREERRIVGEHVLTEAEVRRAVIFEDAVAVNTYHIDFHWPDRMQRAGTGITDMLDPHHLPLRMMIPQGAKNLLVAGRGASGDQTAMSAYRVMAVVAQMGFAAGHAARLCTEMGADLTTLDVARLQAAIEAGGQSLNLSDYGEYLRCDLLTHEAVPGVVVAEGTVLALRQERNACFVVTWSTPRGECWAAGRREKQWSAPRRAAESVAQAKATARTTLVDGAWVWVDVVAGKVCAKLSRDAGATWSHERELAGAALAAVAPVVIATQTGLAVAYASTSGQVMFWHGSVDRIVDGAPKAAALRLDAPPEHVDAPHSLRA